MTMLPKRAIAFSVLMGYNSSIALSALKLRRCTRNPAGKKAKMARYAILVSIVLIATACSGVTIPTPDLVGTRVAELRSEFQTMTAEAPTPTPSLTATSTPTSTPTPTRTRGPTRTPRPTWTPSPTAIPVPNEEKAFIRYLRKKYSAIAGKALDIKDILIFMESEWGMNWVDIEITEDSALYVFMEQSRSDAMAYAENLHRDVKEYFAEEECSAYVSFSWYADDLEDYMFGSDWIYVGDYESGKGWYVSWTLVEVHFIEGRDSVDVFNYE